MGTGATVSRRAVLAGVTAAVLVLGLANAARAVGSDLVELEVLGVIPMDAESASLLVLRQKGARTVLPVFVGRPEATDIDLRLKERVPERGRGPDLLHKSIEALGGKVAKVIIDGSQATLYRARVTLEQGGRHVDVAGRPSDSVALAMIARAPIYAPRSLIAEAGLTEEDLGRTHGRQPSASEDADRDPAAGPVVTF